MKKLLIAAAALALAACSSQKADSPMAGDWKVAPERSRVSFVTIKNGTVAESHHFEGVSGDVKADGTATVKIDLKQLKTQPDTRFQRMQEHLFEVATMPEATVTAKLKPAAYEGMTVGESRTETIPLNIDLHGTKVDYDAEVNVVRAGPDTVVVTTTNPIIIEAGDFNLTGGLAKLQELATLKAITPAAPATFTITLTR